MFSALDIWKIVDNLRRSLVQPALLLSLIAAWLWAPGSPLVWTAAILVITIVPFITSLGLPSHRAWQLSALFRRNQHSILRWLLSLVFMPYEALLSADAILTTLVRLVRRKYLLEWTTAAHTTRLLGSQVNPRIVWQHMLSTTLFVTLLGSAIMLVRPSAVLVAAPWLAVWLMSPLVARWISLPRQPRQPSLTGEQRRELRKLSRRTWLFFEEFVGPQDHWLPPDHYQHSPRGIVAHHTSPTNIGLMILSTLAAYDFGYLGLLELAVRTRMAFESLDKLERYRGHLLNWYDTQTLAPLPPRYVSTVDSGNLAGCLLAFKQGLQELTADQVVRPERCQSLLTMLDLVGEALSEWRGSADSRRFDKLQARLSGLIREIQSVQDQPLAWPPLLAALSRDAWPAFTRDLAEFLAGVSSTRSIARLTRLRVYTDRVVHELFSLQRDLDTFVPWVALLGEIPASLSATQDPALAAAASSLQAQLDAVPTFAAASSFYADARAAVDRLVSLLETRASADTGLALDWCHRMRGALEEAQVSTSALLVGFEDLREQVEAEFQKMDFSFLFDSDRCLFHSGYNVDAERLDNSYYDLIASESRLASLIAIARGDVPQEHWLHLARPLTRSNGTAMLMSWSGTMFEYLMPRLVMRHYDDTLITHSVNAAVKAQIDYAHAHGIPWGISESGFYAFDGNLNYQYHAFGVPDVAFKREQGKDLVIAPYASLLALPVAPQAVLENIERMKAVGLLDTYGFYEAVDYTARRMELGRTHEVVREYMAHHHGMTLIALLNALHKDVMVDRFHRDLRIQSVELLLQEQIPDAGDLREPIPSSETAPRNRTPAVLAEPWRVSPGPAGPALHVLSNGRYTVMVTEAGAGFSEYEGAAITRWRPDTTQDDWGTWIYVKDLDRGALWSASAQPTGVVPEWQEVDFFPYQAEYKRREHDLSLRMTVTVPPDDDVEIRRIWLTNHASSPRRLAICSYAEVVLAPQEADRRHQAFSKLFIESEYVPEVTGLLFQRRPRAAGEDTLYAVHMLVAGPEGIALQGYDTDRATFMGRMRTARCPQALDSPDVTLSGAVGRTLDPIMALAANVEVPPHATVELAYLTLAAGSRAEALALADAYHNWPTIEYAFAQVRYQAEREMSLLALDSAQIERIQRLLSALLYPQAALRAPSDVLAANTKAQPGLWAYGISGDYPILLVQVGDESELELVHELLQAHTFWRSRGIATTLVILNERDTGYTQELYNHVHRLIVRAGSQTWINRHDGIFILRGDQMPDDDRTLLKAAARVYLEARIGSLASQLARDDTPVYLPPFLPAGVAEVTPPLAPVERPDNLLFDNGIGGFRADSQEYVIYLEPGAAPPAPWINVIANPEFGFTISEAGGGFSWAVNSSENRLTPWRNDPLSDEPGEILYLRDEETGEVWSPTPLPAGEDIPYLVRHGAGYTIFEHHSHGLKHELCVYAAPQNPAKIIRLRLENTWPRVRRITVTYFAEWVLSTHHVISQPYIIPEFDADGEVLMARNPYSIEFGQHTSFLVASKTLHGLTTDRTEFLGRLGTYKLPAALTRVGLGGAVRAGVDPCAALQVHIDLAPGETQEVHFVLGQGQSRAEALRLARLYKDRQQAEAAWEEARQQWDEVLNAVQVNTPDPAMNLIVPWLLYQDLSCRVWGRSALYQSGGAYGFRDQLQDVMALVYSRPDLMREHLLRAASHQFEAGDVLHWWHPPSGRGVRTRFSDDLLWLPFVVAYYVSTTGDEAVLDEEVPFLNGEPLKPDEAERYDFYPATQAKFSLYEHCRRALERGFTQGAHGLPLMGTGDWNDGMNRVGEEGKGESVWVGWFLIAVLRSFIPLCERRGDAALAGIYRERVAALQQAIEQHGWDGAWYRRAYYDDGTPLGSAQNRECRIDSIAQSWSILSGAGEPERAQQAMQSVLDWLVHEDERLLLLFTPPFNETPRDPGYIKAYPPGIRENGGQYTHAAIWTAWAFAEMGDSDMAKRLFDLLNPIHHASSTEQTAVYRVEPYVVAADVYSAPPHEGRGGWTWYTGSSGWLYRLAVEAILGLQLAGDVLMVNPTIPSDWPGFSVTLRHGQTTYQIQVTNPHRTYRGVQRIVMDGEPAEAILLRDDGDVHVIEITLGEPDRFESAAR